jgi:hypothetical protein
MIWRWASSRRGRMTDQRDPKNQLAHKDTAPDSGDQPMRKTHLRQLPRGVETSLPLQVTDYQNIRMSLQEHSDSVSDTIRIVGN